MLTKEITYEDIDGNEQKETFWFQLSKAEATKNMLVGGKNGETYEERLRRLGNMTEEDLKNGMGHEVLETFEEILKSSVGKRDGKLFRKTQDIRDHFEFSGAYDAFFMEMLASPDSGASYIRAIMPVVSQQNIDDAMVKQRAQKIVDGEVTTGGEMTATTGVIEHTENLPTRQEFPAGAVQAMQTNQQGTDDAAAWQAEGRYATQQELRKMSPEDMRFAMQAKLNKVFG